jgi:ParB-like chromosome segregation protein Spo0J
MKRPSTITVALAAITLVALLILGTRVLVAPALPEGAYMAVDGKAISNQHIDKIAKLAYPSNKPLSSAARTSLIDALAITEAIIAVADERGVSVSEKELQAPSVGFAPGLSAKDKSNWRLRVALLDKMAKEDAGEVPVPSAAAVGRLAEQRRAASETPGQRSYIEIQTRSKKKAMRAFVALAGRNPSDAAVKLSDDPAAPATGGGHQAINKGMLSSAAGSAVFSAKKGIPTQPAFIDGRWRTYLVVEIIPGLKAAPISELRNQARGALSEEVWAGRYQRAELKLLSEARERVACSPQWFEKDVCSLKAGK